MSPRASIEHCLASRNYEDALRQVDSGGDGLSPGDVWRLRRQCLARMGRFGEAVEAGRVALALGPPTAEDQFRQAQVLIEVGAWEEGFDLALAAFEAKPDDHRIVAPLAQAALAVPPLLGRLRDAVPAKAGSVSRPVPGRVFVPQHLPFYAAFDADHPGTMGMVKRTSGFDFHIPGRPDAGWLTRIGAAVERTVPVLEALCGAHAVIDRSAAARFLGARIAAALPDAGGATLDFLTNVPFTVGQRPFILWYDVLPTLFVPFQPFDRMAVSVDSPVYWMTRALLESSHCTAIVTHYPLAGNPIHRLFRSPAIAGKLVFVNPCEAEVVDGEAPEPASRPADGPIRLLFTSSRNYTDEGFFYRGGVDVLCAFLELAAERKDVELVLRTPLPGALSERLRTAAAKHPRIHWYPDPLPAEEYRRLVAGAHVFLMPASVVYRNGVVHAMKEGLVPVVSDIVGMEALVEDGGTGLVVPGRARVLRVDADPPALRHDLEPVLRATDGPGDPAFYRAFRDRLRGLLSNRDTIAAISARAAAHARQRWSATEHLRAFDDCLGGAVEMAEAIHRSGEPVSFPKQTL